MAITNFIPTVWSESLYRALDKQYIGVANCNREFEGDIKNCGSSVKICGIGTVNVTNYTKNTDMSTPQDLSDTSTNLVINYSKCFNFQIDDIDKAQSKPKLMDAAMKIAASALANEADKKVYELFEETENLVFDDNASSSTILSNIIKARELLYNANVSSTEEVVLEVSPAIASLILMAKIDLATDNKEAIENGYLGSIGGCKIFVSNNIVKSTEGGIVFNKCIMRTKRAIAFAEQLSEIEAYRPEKRFADAVKGLHLFGVKVIYPEEMVLLDLGIPQEE
ncbi:MAG: hypothetical protein E7670_08045 [Ruminococcaceae bacterium]|nr:hypothetical protein [Oscillospiraceae bacterium]